MGEIADSAAAAEDWAVEHRFRAVVEVLDGAPIAEVARRYGTSRQSLHTWLRRFREGGGRAVVSQAGGVLLAETVRKAAWTPRYQRR